MHKKLNNATYQHKLYAYCMHMHFY